MREEFDLYDIVKWTSQAGGKTREKVGMIVAIVPAGEPAYESFNEIDPQLKTNEDAPRGMGMSRKHTSYLVLSLASNRGREVYWPKVSQLRKSDAVELLQFAKKSKRYRKDIEQVIELRKLQQNADAVTAAASANPPIDDVPAH